jgi:hypothetical protein
VRSPNCLIFSKDVMPLTLTSTPYFIIPYLQPFQDGRHSNFWGEYKTCTSQRRTMKLCIMIDLERCDNFKLESFVRKQKVRTWRALETVILILFHGDNSWSTALRQMKFGTVKHHERTYKLHLNRTLFHKAFKYGDGAKCWSYVGTNACSAACRFL